uniref:Thiamine biosynthesis protein n=1 Tax=Acetithermum autotrophicum TaxID=1446466 RepID=H5SRX8_ACEAU|nr:thiamine biosynthesis protein [Candidatus Acetothermum autotrophicum]
MAKAISLFSGSLASIVATKLILQQPNVTQVLILHLRSPFFREHEAIPSPHSETGFTHRTVKDIAQEICDMPFRSQNIKKDFRELAKIVHQPSGTNGSFLKRTCLNCRQLLLKKALRCLKRVGADFIVTGEVVGERGLGAAEIEKLTELAGAKGLVLRPLSAKLLSETIPEQKGWVDRATLKGFRASDKEKIRALARALGVEVSDFPAQRRCKLTVPYFGPRLGDLLKEEKLTMNALELLEFPLYYKRPPDVTIVLGRDDEEKRRLQNFFLPEDLRLYLPGPRGPMALVRANWKEKSPSEIAQIIQMAARVAASHLSEKPFGSVQAHWRFESSPETFRISVKPFQSPRELEEHQLKLV